MSPIRLRTVAGFLLAFSAMAVCLLAGASAAILLNQQPAAQPNSQATPTVAIARTPAASATSSVKNTTVPATNAPTPLAQATSVYNWKGALPPVPAPITLPMGSPEYGMQAFLWWRQDTMDRDIGLVKKAGFSWVKQNFGWRDIETAKGQFNWGRPDRIVLSTNDAGVDMVVRLDFAPDWAAPGCHSDDPSKDLIQGPPKDLQDYANFVH